MKKKLNICYLAPGNSIHSHKWINTFSKKNTVTWFFSGNLDYKIKNVKYYKLSGGLFFFLSPLIFLIKVLITKPDIIHIHSISKNLFIGFLVMLFFKKKVILNPWGSDFFYPNIIVSLLQKFISNNIIFTDSFIILNKLKKKNKVFKINFGVDLIYFNNVHKKNLSKKKIIFCPRGYSKLYNQFLIIKFIKNNISKLKDYLFIFSGSIDLKEFNFLISYIKKNRLIKNIKLFGNLKKNKYKSYLIKSSLLISASRSDAGLSSVIAEAMSCKCLVLCTSNRDNPYWVKHMQNGFLFKNDDIKNFSKTFFKIMNISKSKTNNIRNKAREIQLKNNNLIKEMQKVDSIYKKIALKNKT